MDPVIHLNMNRLIWSCVLLFSASTCCQSQQPTAMGSGCDEEARRVLGSGAQVLKVGDFLNLGSIECLAVVPYSTSHDAAELAVRRGFVVQKEGAVWRSLLRFKENIRNPRGFIGIDFIDSDYSFGFAMKSADERSDGTPGFTIFLTYLNHKLRPEGLPVEVSWNRKVSRFQEYAPNELDPPDFKQEIAHPPFRKQ